MEVLKIKSKSNPIAKAFNLDFCSQFGYYIGDAYNDNKGNTLPNYMYYNGQVYALKYFDGCFNPYLVRLDSKDFGIVVDSKGRVLRVHKANTSKLQAHYQNSYGSDFSMI